MNVYDFDGTIYDGDSTVDFYLFSLLRHPSLLRFFPVQTGAYFKYLCGFCTKEAAKEEFYSYFSGLCDIQREVGLFWDRNYRKIKHFYLKRHRPDDVVISASGRFLLSDICKRLGIRRLIASEVDIKTGHLLSPNCHGTEKLKRLKQEYPGEIIDEFYSDSLSDEPLAKAARAAYMVKKNRISRWKV